MTTVSLNSGFGVRIDGNTSLDMLEFSIRYHVRTFLYFIFRPKLVYDTKFIILFNGNHSRRKF